MSLKVLIYACLILVTVGGLYFVWQLTSRTAYESAEYEVLETEGRIEIREYPDLKLAATNMPLDSQGNDGSFVRLFRYISGSNTDRRKIAMTTPVFMQPNPDSEQAEMSFVIPTEIANSQVPAPTDQQVRIKTRPAGTFAVIRFSGRLTRETADQAEQELRKWMMERGLSAEDSVQRAGYDPPWTPGPLRRNEILIRLN